MKRVGFSMRISKWEFQQRGGLSNPKLYRRMIGRSWTYWMIRD